MTQDPKKLPPWLGRGKKKAQDAPKPDAASQPPQEEPQASGDLPPWLREDHPLPPASSVPKVKRVAPPTPEQPGGLPPWLAGIDEPKTYKIGGTELSEEYLKSADDLPETLDSGQTYDAWIAAQIESKREKDIEEEVPDLTLLPGDSPAAEPPKGTGQLPDWFLGLEELDTSDAPEWFNTDEGTPKLAPDQMPPWINDMMREQPDEAQEAPADEIGSFFSALGGSPPAEEEEVPDIDWFSQPDTVDSVPSEDFFAQLVGAKPQTAPPTPAPPEKAKGQDQGQEKEARPHGQYDLPDIDDFEEEENAEPQVAIPQNELDAFFDNVAAGRASSPTDDIEEPDMDWLTTREPVVEEPEPEPEPPPAPPAEETLSWLNELQGIVNSATRPLQPKEDDLPEMWNAPPVAQSVEPEAFEWPEAPTAEETPPPEAAVEAAPDAEQDSDWLSTITPDDQPTDEESLAPAGASLLTGRLIREQPQAAPEVDLFAPEEVEAAPEAELFAPEVQEAAPEVEKPPTDRLIPEDELQSGWLSDDIFAQEARQDQPASSDEDFFNLLEANSDANVIDEDVGGSLAESDTEAQPQYDDFFASLGVSDADQSATEEAQRNDDFFAALGMNDETDQPPAASEEGLFDWQDQAEDAQQNDETQATADDEQPYDDFFASLGMSGETDQPPAASEEGLFEWQGQAEDAQQSDDFFASLGMSGADQAVEEAAPSDADQAQTAKPQTDGLSLLYASVGTGDEADQEPPSDEAQVDEQPTTDELSLDHFYTALGMSDETDQPPAAEAPGDDFFASYGIGEEDQAAAEETPQADALYAEPGIGEEDQPATEEVPQEDDFFASYGIGDDQAQAEAVSMDDFFASYGMNDEAAQTTSAAQPVDQADEAPPEEDFFAALGMIGGEDEQVEQSQPQDQAEEMPPEEDFFASLGMTDDDTNPSKPEANEFQWEAHAEMPPEEDFFSALGMIGDQQASEASAETPPDEAPPEEDFFSALGMIGDPNAPPSAPVPGRKSELPSVGDVDSYLASLNVDQPEVTPTTDDLFRLGGNMDIDALFSEPMMPDRPQPENADSIPGANEDWLAQLQASVGEVSASAIVRQKEDRPVEDLSDRLQRLRQRAEQIPDETSAPQNDVLSDVLPDTGATLAPAPFVGATAATLGSVMLTPEQQNKVNLLKALVPSDDRARTFHLSAIEATYDSPFMPGLEDSAESIVQPEKTEAPPKARRRQRQRARVRVRIDRFLIAVLLAAAVIAPFLLPGFRVGSLPPTAFAAGSSAQMAFSQINAVQPGSLVLVALEYGPSASAELDGMTEALLRNILLRAAYPVVISSNPIGLLRAPDLFASINADNDFLARIGLHHPLAANSDYYIVHYLPGSVIGLRAFSQDTAALLLTDIQGQATNLSVRSLRDFALVTVITDRAETLRAYGEQIAPLTRAPLVSAVSYGAAPLAEPYARAFGDGLLVGYRDGYTYNALISTINAVSITERIRIVPTLEAPTPEPNVPQTGALAATEEATAEATAQAPQSLGTATVISKAAANMRGGPGTSNPIIETVPSGTTVTILGYNSDHTWVNVRLDSGQEGWISASLLQIGGTQTSLSKLGAYGKMQHLDPGTTPTPPPSEVPTEGASTAATEASTAEASATPTATFTATHTPSPTATHTPSPTATATATSTPEVVAGVSFTLPPHSAEYQDERWYAMNLGIIASALIISFGAVVNVLRGLLRGRRG